MNKIIFRFYLVKEGKFIEVAFDSRLSFNDNFKLLNSIYPIDNYKIYDKDNNAFLSLNVPLKDFNFSYYTKLCIFTRQDIKQVNC